jgi:hypothetical protein
MRRSLSLVALVVSFWGCSSVPAKSPEPCPAKLVDYKEGVSTADDVRRCLGVPYHESHEKDGRFVLQYRLDGGVIVAFAFAENGMLLRAQGYKTR